jgi:hypothetical protein
MLFRGHGKLADSWWGATAPPNRVAIGASTYVGVAFHVTVPGRVMGFRAFIEQSTNNRHWGFLWDANNQKIISAWSFFDRGNTLTAQWLQKWERPSFRPVVNQQYLMAVKLSLAYYRHTAQLSAPVTANHITFESGFTTTALGPPETGTTPTTNANGVDILFQPD